MKTIIKYSIALAVCFVGSINSWSQLTIGSDEEPCSGAILDLKSTNKGLLSPHINLKSDPTWFTLDLSASADTVASKLTAKGMLIYNTSTAMVTGNSIILTAVANGSASSKNYVWQWSDNGTDFSDLATTDAGSYQFSPAAAGYVRVKVNNCAGIEKIGNTVFLYEPVPCDPDDPNCSGGVIIGGGTVSTFF